MATRDHERRAGQTRRDKPERRSHTERRGDHAGPPGGEETERRTGFDRRLPGDRRDGDDRRLGPKH